MHFYKHPANGQPVQFTGPNGTQVYESRATRANGYYVQEPSD
jgi:hypothetical protein